MPSALAGRIQPRFVVAVDGVVFDAVAEDAGLIERAVVACEHLDWIDHRLARRLPS